ncbi:MAG: hypothetical protein GXO26_07970 [Crenarchaeota archaeon]|nr:hypothetical protein [Thermoproteota archaeon]
MRIIVKTTGEAWKVMENYVNTCLDMGGVPIFKTRYGGFPLELDNRPTVLIYCYAPLRGRLEPIDLTALDSEWVREWEKIDTTYGYWRDIYGREFNYLFRRRNPITVLVK